MQFVGRGLCPLQSFYIHGIMDKFQNKIIKYIRDNELVAKGDAVTVGLSGGADSVCLFTLFSELKRLLGISLQAVHVNHNLRGDEALRDQEFCRSLAETYEVGFAAVSVDVTGYAAELGLTEEEAGRVLRYAALNDKAEKFAAECGAQRAMIAVAHHADDQAETVLMNLMRGSGLKGLTGMSPVRDNIIRPLLCVGREDIVGYLNMRGISYVDDSTNFENDHTRNRLRNIIIPELKKYVNSAASEHIGAAASMIRDADEYITSEAARYVDGLSEPCETDGVTKLAINKSSLKEKARILRRYVIIEALRRLKVPLKDWGEKHFSDIDCALFKGRGYHVDLPGGVYIENAYRETCICIRHSAGRDGNEL